MGVVQFATERKIGSKKYAEIICAESLDKAKEIAKLSGSKVVGTVEGRVNSKTAKNVIQFCMLNDLLMIDLFQEPIFKETAEEHLDAFLQDFSEYGG